MAAAVLGAAAAASGDFRAFGPLRLAILGAALVTVASFPVAPWERLPRWLPALPVAAAFTVLLAPRSLSGVGDWLQLAGAVGMDSVGVVLYLLPWDRLPRRLHNLPPLGAIAALILLGAGLGTSATLLFPIAVLAVLWLTLHHTRGELLTGVVLAAGVFLAPPHLHGGYSDPGARLLYTAIVAVVAVSVHGVVMRTRRQAVEIAGVAREMQLMQEVAATLSATLDVEAILRETVRTAAQMVSRGGSRGRRATIMQVRGDTLVSVAEHAVDGEKLFQGTVYPLDDHPGLRAALAQRATVGGEVEPLATSLDDATVAAVRRAAMRSYLLAPIVVDDHAWGLLSVSAPESDGFDERLQHRLEAIVNVAQLALANALSYERQRRTAHDLATLAGANLALTSESDPDSVLQTLADTARQLVRAQYAAIAVISSDGRRVESFTESGVASEAALETFRPFDMDRGVAGGVVRDRQVVRVHSMGEAGDGEALHTALLGLPLLLHEQLIGAIYLIGKQDGSEFSAGDEVVAAGLAAQAAVAMTNARLVQRLAEHAASDPLTGLRNRREFERILNSLPRQSFAVLAIDVDNLKTLNDEFGHEAGDLVLQITGATLSAVLRGGDVIARVGGDEFAALLLDVEPEIAADVAERMRTALHGTALPHGRARISIGCAPAPRGADPHGVWRAADDALYQAKRSGKDRVVIIEHGRRVRSAVSQSAWAETLVDALDERAMESVYQPIVLLADRSTLAYEALARPTGLAASSGVDGMFHAAQRLGRMRDLDWICRRAALEGMSRAHGQALLFVNVSTVTLLDPIHDVDQMLLLCEWAELDPRRLVLEITERETVRDLDRLAFVAGAYRQHGIRFALDDVGEGHSTLEVMAAVSPEFIKIASSLTTTIERSGSRAAVRATVAFAASTGAAVIAEGVESERVVSTLQEMGVPYGQGFWLGRPQRPASLPEPRARELR